MHHPDIWKLFSNFSSAFLKCLIEVLVLVFFVFLISANFTNQLTTIAVVTYSVIKMLPALEKSFIGTRSVRSILSQLQELEFMVDGERIRQVSSIFVWKSGIAVTFWTVEISVPYSEQLDTVPAETVKT